MREIYRTARQTVAWLGEAGEDTEKVFRAIRLLGGEARVMEREGRVILPERGVVYGELLDDLGDGHAFDCVLGNSWWTRVWTLRRSTGGLDICITVDRGTTRVKANRSLT